MKALLSLAVLSAVAFAGCQNTATHHLSATDPYEPHTVVPEYLKDDKNRLLPYDKAVEGGRADPYLTRGDYSAHYNAQQRYMGDGSVRADYRQQDNVNNNRVRTDGTASALPAADRQFVVDAASGGLYEVRSSELALRNSTNDRIKGIANHMIRDHQRANSDLLAVAKAKNIDVPTTLNTRHQGMLDELNKLTGNQFDEAYLRQQRQAHEEAISLYETAANSASDRDLRNFAKDKIDVLRQHARMISDTNNNVTRDR